MIGNVYIEQNANAFESFKSPFDYDISITNLTNDYHFRKSENWISR